MGNGEVTLEFISQMSPSSSDTWLSVQTMSCSHQEGAKKHSRLVKLHSTLVRTLGILLKVWHVLPACGAVLMGSKWVVLEQHSWVRLRPLLSID